MTQLPAPGAAQAVIRGKIRLQPDLGVRGHRGQFHRIKVLHRSARQAIIGSHVDQDIPAFGFDPQWQEQQSYEVQDFELDHYLYGL